MLERFNRLIDELVERVRAQPSFGWATVVSVDPLQIRYDGQADPVVGSPSRLVSGLAVGDRVWCQRIHRRDIILGAGQAGDTGWQTLTGWTGGFAQSSAPVQYRRLNGYVEFKGSLTNASWSGGFTSFGAFMPVGFRPDQSAMFLMPVNSTTTRTVRFRPDGEIALYGSVASSSWWSFDMIRFPAEG